MKNAKYVGKGLTNKEAMLKHPYKASFGDCRSFTYDRRTGFAKWL